MSRVLPLMVPMLFLVSLPGVARASDALEEDGASTEEAWTRVGEEAPAGGAFRTQAHAWLTDTRIPPVVERLDWTWLAAGVTAFLGAAAVLTAVDARSMERDLSARLEASRTYPQPGSEIVDLAARTRRRALMANVLWGTTGAGLLTTGCILYLEADGAAGSGGGLMLGWRLP